MKFIKKHVGIIVLLLIIILFVAGLIIIKQTFFASENKAFYGNRLEGIKKVKITNDTKSKVTESLADKTKSVKIRIAGRIIYITMDAKDEITLEDAKALGDKSLEGFSDKEKEYYDIQILITNEKNTSQFPIIGYKHHTKGAIVWTQDRAES